MRITTAQLEVSRRFVVALREILSDG